MKTSKFLLAVLSALFFCSCSTPKISYFQDLQSDVNKVKIATPAEIRIQPEDKLSILVNCQDPRLSNMFNLPVILQQVGYGDIPSNRGIACYTVDSKGNIDFPVLGSQHIQGMTRQEVAEHIKKELKSNDLVKDPVVTIEFVNLSVSVMGEVNRPGRYNINKDNFTVLDALSLAGDLTVYGKRDNILVMRNEGGEQHIHKIDLCSGTQVYSSPVFYLKQNDVIYVEPNKTKARQSTVNGNNIRSTSFWISLASLITSIIVLLK